MRMPRWRSGTAVLVVVLTGPVMAVGGGLGRAEAAGPHRVRITHGKFTPAEVRISPGDSVTWVNEDHEGHSVTADDGSFDSHPDCSEDTPGECLPEGDSWSHTFAKAGRYPYHSRTEGQKGVVVVN
jgi:plastocyanin